MAALLPILQDIAPIILPSAVHLAKTPTLPVTASLDPDIKRKPVTLPVLSKVSKKLHVTSKLILRSQVQSNTSQINSVYLSVWQNPKVLKRARLGSPMSSIMLHANSVCSPQTW